jgi:methylated-DNA-[protein]-cysteine S-methyltransferase
MTLTAATLETPVGPLRLVASETGLREVCFEGEPTSADAVAGDSPVLAEAERQLREYFAGTRTIFDVPLDLVGTPFQLDAWRGLATIPYGETVSYAELAAVVDRPHAARAVGAANGRNPIAVVIPCHRVIGASGALTGYGGGLGRKRLLLDLEAGQRTWTLIGADGKPYESPTPGTLGGHRRSKGYGRLDCRAALQWIAKGHYVRHRVFFADEETAVAAGYRPCAVCMPERYAEWKRQQAA